MSRLVEFYQGTGLDTEGRSLAGMWAFSDEEMEEYHDFIQWMFPLREPSQFNPDAPLLTDADVIEFRNDARLHAHLLRSLDRFLSFLGLARRGERIEPGPEFVRRADLWTRPNHNWLRITRVLHCLRILGLQEQAHRLYSCLDNLNSRGEIRISPATLSFWKDATYRT